MSFGLSSAGFSAKTIDDILASIRSKQLTLFGASFAALLDTSVVGQLNGVYANEIADLWELSLAVWRSRFPSTADGVSLDLIAEETGAIRLQPARSTVTLTFSGTNGTTVPSGTQAQVSTTGAVFETTESGVIASGTVALAAQSVDYGPIVAAAGTIDDIVTPIAGVTSVTNALDAELGRDLETDAAFRIRRAELLRVAGKGSVDAIRAGILDQDGVDEAIVFENDTDATNGDGLPPHSFEAVVRGGDDQDIVDSIWSDKPAGIATFGSESGIAVDTNGDSHTVNFSRPDEIDIYVAVTVETDDDYPVDGDDQIKQAVVDFWEAFDKRIGKDVVVNQFYEAIYAIAGVTNVTTLAMDVTVSPTNVDPIVIGPREIAVFDTSRVDVTS